MIALAGSGSRRGPFIDPAVMRPKTRDAVDPVAPGTVPARPCHVRKPKRANR